MCPGQLVSIIKGRQLRFEVGVYVCLFLLGVSICRIPLTSPRLEHKTLPDRRIDLTRLLDTWHCLRQSADHGNRRR